LDYRSYRFIKIGGLIMNVKEVLEKQIKDLDKRIEKCEDEELRSSLVREMVSLSSEYSKVEANEISLTTNVANTAVKYDENKKKLKGTMITGGIIIGSSILGIVLDSVTGRIEKRKESKMQDNLTRMLK